MRRLFLALLLAASVTPALAQDNIVNMKVSLWVPPAHPLVPATQAWAADIEAGKEATMLAWRRANVAALNSRARIAMALRNNVGPSVQQMPPKRHGIPPL